MRPLKKKDGLYIFLHHIILNNSSVPLGARSFHVRITFHTYEHAHT